MCAWVSQRSRLRGRGALTLKLVAFDLDGTLVDSIADIAGAANAALVEYAGAESALSPAVIRSFVGGGARQLVERCLAHVFGRTPRPHDVETVFGRFIILYRERLVCETRLFPGLDIVLRALKDRGVRLAILSNKPGEMSRALIVGLGLDGAFSDVIGGDDIDTKKPDPAGLRMLMSRADALGRETVLVGDSRVDVETAANAGAFSAGVLWGYDTEQMLQARPNVTADTPGELLERLVRYF